MDHRICLVFGTPKMFCEILVFAVCEFLNSDLTLWCLLQFLHDTRSAGFRMIDVCRAWPMHNDVLASRAVLGVPM
jgi:hypothetical protein